MADDNDNQNLRDALAPDGYFQEPQSPVKPAAVASPVPEEPYAPRLVLGMTAIQRLVVALMLFLITCVVGSFVLVLAQKVYLPF